MTIKEFIEKAIEGGWRQKEYPEFNVIEVSNVGVHLNCHGVLGDFEYTFYREKILLDPLAWQAVGKVEGWDVQNVQGTTHLTDNGTKRNYLFIENGWMNKMHAMINALAEGKTLEEYISTL